MFENLNADISRYRRIDGITPASSCVARLRLLCFSYGLHAITVYRLGQFIKRKRWLNIIFPLKILLFIIYYLLNFIVKNFYGINISLNADIGKGFYIGHFGNIFIGNCEIGQNCSVNQQTYIGLITSLNKRESRILFGDNVWIGAHVTVHDGVVVGNSATISGGSIVKTSVRENSLVMGNPARVIIAQYDNLSLL